MPEIKNNKVALAFYGINP